MVIEEIKNVGEALKPFTPLLVLFIAFASNFTIKNIIKPWIEKIFKECNIIENEEFRKKYEDITKKIHNIETEQAVIKTQLKELNKRIDRLSNNLRGGRR